MTDPSSESHVAETAAVSPAGQGGDPQDGAAQGGEHRRGGLVGEIREKWARSKWSVIAIFLSFALAGMTTLRISRPLLHLILGDQPPKWLWWTLRILVIVPIYEMVLVGWGTILGQGKFFRSKLRKTLRRISTPFARRAHG